MAEENEDGGDDTGGTAVIILDASGEVAAVVSEGGDVETPAPVEAPASDAVEIARIEADTAITLAVIGAETTEAAIAANNSAELDQCRLRITELEGLNTGLLATVSTLEAQLTPAPLVTEPPPPPPSESVEEDGLRENPEVVEVEEAPPAPEAPKPKRKVHRWI